MNDCPRFNKWIGGCKFEPRYSLGASTWKPEHYIGTQAAQHEEAHRTKTYECDVCVRCGKRVERTVANQTPSPSTVGVGPFVHSLSSLSSDLTYHNLSQTAAAPELLSALITIANSESQNFDADMLRAIARAALAQAA